MAMHQCKQRMLLYSNQLLNIVRKKIAIKANMVQEYCKNNNTCRNKIEGKYVMDTKGQFPFIVWTTDFSKKKIFECGKDQSYWVNKTILNIACI